MNIILTSRDPSLGLHDIYVYIFCGYTGSQWSVASENYKFESENNLCLQHAPHLRLTLEARSTLAAASVTHPNPRLNCC